VRRPLAALGAVAVTAGLLAGSLAAPLAGASSHREAPLISKDPTVDNTDLYAFVSPDQPDTVTIIADYIPLEAPAGGPNFYSFDGTARYEIHVDNTGDGQDDITYRFTFNTKVRNYHTFLYNTNTINSLDDPDWNEPQFYSVTRIEHGVTTSLGSGLTTPPVNIGPRSTPNYDSLAAAAVHTLNNGIKVFAGQRDDPFFVDLGSIFDLLGLRPFNNLHLIPLPTAPGVDAVAGYNTHVIAMQIPITQLTRDHKPPTGPTDPRAVIGIYASASRARTTVLNGDGTTTLQGDAVQVSRLGNPLINEVIIPLGMKDYWNAQEPANDAQFVKFYTSPEIAGLINLLYPSLPDTPTTQRTDLVEVLLTGIPGVNFTGKTPADLLRLNMAIPPSAAVGQGNRLGALAGDLAGFPNGRRLEDDVVDIELRAAACGYGDFLAGLLGLCNLSPNNTLGDGVDTNDLPFMQTFPYVSTPHDGYSSS